MMSRFFFMPTPIDGLHLIRRTPYKDERGYFERLFCIEDMKIVLGNRKIVQINHSYTMRRGTIRGLHYQHPPHSEMKIVSCIRGAVFDVAVDLRKNSPTFLKFHCTTLAQGDHCAFVIPEGFAHGFQTLEDNCELLYFHTAQFEPQSEGGLNAFDPRLGIEWPLAVSERSPRDQQLEYLTFEFFGLNV
jgi:dTDP-4-dehydrorhamnose 3,5-epimerase